MHLYIQPYDEAKIHTLTELALKRSKPFKYFSVNFFFMKNQPTVRPICHLAI